MNMFLADFAVDSAASGSSVPRALMDPSNVPIFGRVAGQSDAGSTTKSSITRNAPAFLRDMLSQPQAPVSLMDSLQDPTVPEEGQQDGLVPNAGAGASQAVQGRVADALKELNRLQALSASSAPPEVPVLGSTPAAAGALQPALRAPPLLPSNGARASPIAGARARAQANPASRAGGRAAAGPISTTEVLAQRVVASAFTDSPPPELVATLGTLFMSMVSSLKPSAAAPDPAVVERWQANVDGLNLTLQDLQNTLQDLQNEHTLLQSSSSTALTSLATMTDKVEEQNTTILRLQDELLQANNALAAAVESPAVISLQADLDGANMALAFAQEEAAVAKSDTTVANSARDLAQNRLILLNARMLELVAQRVGDARSAGGQGAAGGQGGPVQGE